jgi:hypothetical protein
MLIALLTMLLLGGGGADGPMPEGFTKYAKEVVAEQSRQEQIKDVVKAMTDISKTYAKEAGQMAKEAYELNRDYNATPSQLEEAIDRYRARRGQLESDLVVERLKLRELLTREEWTEVMRRVDEAQE